MTGEQMIAFAVFAFVASVTPGPSNVMLLSSGSAVGVVRGLPCLAGVLSGMGILMFGAALGLGSLILEFPALLQLLNVAGALFLFWLAWKIASAKPVIVSGDSRAIGFTSALMFQWVNPKGWLVTASAVGTYLSAGSNDSLTQALL